MRTQRKTHSRLWVYLLYLGLVTSLILSATLAKYASGVAGTGTATVAAVAGGAGVIQPDPIEMPLEGLAPGAEVALKFQVVNYSGDTVSEVALDYDITVKTTGNLPLQFTLASEAGENGVKISDGGQEKVPNGDAILTGQTLTGGAFPLAEDASAQKQAHTYTLKVAWPDGESNAGYADEIDLLTIAIAARQRLAGEG